MSAMDQITPVRIADREIGPGRRVLFIAEIGINHNGDLDIAMVMTRPLPTRDGTGWPWPTVAGWKKGWPASRATTGTASRCRTRAVGEDPPQHRVAALPAVQVRRPLRPAALLARNPDPSEAEIRKGLEGNLCRCTGYHNIVRAVQHAAAASGAGVTS